MSFQFSESCKVSRGGLVLLLIVGVMCYGFLFDMIDQLRDEIHQMAIKTDWKNITASLNLDSFLYFKSGSENDVVVTTNSPSQIPEKLILTYTTFYGTTDWLGLNFTRCTHRCRLTSNKSDLARSDAVLFGAIETAMQNIRLPPRGPALEDQIRVFIILESPDVYTTQFSMDRFHNEFNWTMTYRRDSDVPVLAREFEPLTQDNVNQSLSIPTLSSIRRKKLVAGMISRCGAESGRDSYVAQLRKHIPIDIYGTCGNLTCSKYTDCYKRLSKFYKFWLSFENSLCKDYITEKFFEPLRNGMVPIVFGRGSYSEIAPKGSYIDVRDSKSPGALAEYLLHLDKHPEEYLAYFEWMKNYTIPASTDYSERAWCGLCEKLHRRDSKSRNWHASPGDWFRFNNTGKSLCVRHINA